MTGPRGSSAPMRIAIIVYMVAPYAEPLFTGLAERENCELLLVSETPMERDRHWAPERELPFEHVLLDSWTLDLAWLAVGSGFKTRFDTYLYVPKRPLAPLYRFSPDVVVVSGGGVVLAREHRRPRRAAAPRLGHRALVGKLQPREADVAPTPRRAVGQDVHALG